VRPEVAGREAGGRRWRRRCRQSRRLRRAGESDRAEETVPDLSRWGTLARGRAWNGLGLLALRATKCQRGLSPGNSARGSFGQGKGRDPPGIP
jgi:hypothetical protein